MIGFGPSSSLLLTTKRLHDILCLVNVEKKVSIKEHKRLIPTSFTSATRLFGILIMMRYSSETHELFNFIHASKL